MRQEQKPGLASDWESAASAGLRTLASLLNELDSNENMAGRSDAESAIALHRPLSDSLPLSNCFCY